MFIYSKIEELIKERQYNIKEFFESIGMSDRGWREMKKQNSLKISNLEKIAEKLGISVDQITDNGEIQKVKAKLAETEYLYLDAMRELEKLRSQGVPATYTEQERPLSVVQESVAPYNNVSDNEAKKK